MKHRKLRIAWSVAWCVVAVLLCVWWVRSYEYSDQLFGPIGKSHVFIFGSSAGNLTIRATDNPGIVKDFGQGVLSRSIPLSQVFGRKSAFSFRGIRFQKLDDGFVVPHWSFILLATAFAAVSWLPIWSSRFSLRALLIAITLVAMVLGLVVWAAK